VARDHSTNVVVAMPFAVLAFTGCLATLRFQEHASWLGSIVTALFAGAVAPAVILLARPSRRN
jgi:hypothetical protein